jgi:predicted lysophospholipase L1 biosynthesis ABC-type transport system permease subunit
MSAVNFITPGWFSALGTRVVAGRDVTDRDRTGTPPVALANRAFARKFLNGASPLGHTIATTVGLPGHPLSIEVVGVVEDAVHSSLRYPVSPMLYLPMAQVEWLPSVLVAQVDLSVRSDGVPPLQLARSVAAAIHAVNPDMVVTFRSLTDQVNATLTQERVVALLSGFFGGLALLLAALGLYGVTAYAVGRRRTELGIRMALGAAPAGIIRLVLSRVTLLVGIGVMAGAGVSIWASRFVATLLYGLGPHDPMTLVGAAIVLGIVGGAAGWLPAYRASRIDPAEVLRDS